MVPMVPPIAVVIMVVVTRIIVSTMIVVIPRIGVVATIIRPAIIRSVVPRRPKSDTETRGF
jgi:hypothetical protein